MADPGSVIFRNKFNDLIDVVVTNEEWNDCCYYPNPGQVIGRVLPGTDSQPLPYLRECEGKNGTWQIWLGGGRYLDMWTWDDKILDCKTRPLGSFNADLSMKADRSYVLVLSAKTSAQPGKTDGGDKGKGKAKGKGKGKGKAGK